MAADGRPRCRSGAGWWRGARSIPARRAIRTKDRDRDRSEPRARAVSHRSGLIISACNGAPIVEFAALLPDLRQAGDAATSAILLGSLRPDRSRPLAQGQLPDPDRRSARGGLRLGALKFR